MSLRKDQTGFSPVEVIIVLVVVGVLGFVGYTVYSRQQSKPAATNTEQQAPADDVPEAPEIKSTSDLDKASETLDKVKLDDNGDTSQLDTETSAF